MPLDIQPLSPTRRIITLLLLLALFAASLGFAQYLVIRARRTPVPQQPLPGADDTDNDT